jgi:hypothetical protein
MLLEARVEVVGPPEYTLKAASDEGGGNMPQVVVLNCPACGGPLETGASHCTYCHARVQISADGTRVSIAGVVCQGCGWENAPDRLFCGQCGANLMEKCHKCGKPNPMALKYCGGCGSDLSEARRQVVERMVQDAKSKGWIDSPGAVSRHLELVRTVALPEETIIVLRTWGDRLVDLQDSLTGEKSKTAFVVTDRSFIFAEPASRGFLGSHPEVIKRVPFDEVTSLTVDEGKDDLVINFERGQARLPLRNLEPLTAHGRASGIVHYFKPFLPIRLQADW